MTATKREFGFTVTESDDWQGDEGDQWMVYLPHQCDGWAITGPTYYDGFVAHDKAVDRLELFIAEATDALLALKARAALGEFS